MCTNIQRMILFIIELFAKAKHFEFYTKHHQVFNMKLYFLNYTFLLFNKLQTLITSHNSDIEY